MRRTAWLALALGAWLVLAAAAAAQTVTLPDPEETVNDVVDTVTSTAEGASGTVESTAEGASGTAESTAEGASGTVEETAGIVTSTSGTLSGGGTGSSSSGATTSSGSGTLSGSGTGSSSSGATTSSGGGTSSGAGSSSARSGSGGTEGRANSRAPRYRSRFDRLPRRLEALLERIELGRNVRENLARLERMLASASPRLRTRVLRLLRAEIRRLRANGTTRAERKRIERLQLVRRALTRSTAPAPTSSASPQVGASAPAGGAERPAAGHTRPGRAGGGILGAEAGGDEGDAQTRPLPTPPLPDQPGNFPFTLGLILLALLALGFVGVVAGVTSHLVGRARSG